MEIFHGYKFFEYSQRERQLGELINRAVKAGVITESGAAYLRRLA